MDAPLKFGKQVVSPLQADAPAEETLSISEIIEQLVGFVRRQFPIFLFIVSCSIALGMVYFLTTPPSFTAHAMLLIDSSKARILQQQQSSIGEIPIDTAQVETQVEILKSENIGLSVVKDLKLAADPEFTGSAGGLVGRIFGFFNSSDTRSETQLVRKALSSLLASRTITRVGRTYVLDIAFTSLKPARSAEIANALADAYIVDQLNAKYQATRRASSWLQDRINELRQQAADADRAVLDYREKNKIVSVGGSSPGGPRLLGEQQLEDLNTQLGSARAAAEEAKARLERIGDVLKKDVPDATVTDSLHSEVINRLRNQYLDISAKEAIWSARYGSSHLAAVNLRTQMAELRRSILDELGRIAQGYKSDYEISKSRVEGLEKEIQKLVASSQLINRDRLGLTDLESTAKVYHSIYDNFLQRYMEAIQQQSFPITEARVISAADPPERKSGPLAPAILGVAGVVGILLSFGIAVFREAVDRVFRTTRQLETALHTNCLAVLPAMGSSPHSLESKSLSGAQPERSSRGLDLSKISELAKSGPARRTFPEDAAPSLDVSERARSISLRKPILRLVIADPLSAFAEAFRSIKVAADIGGSRTSNKVIAVTSTVAGEGKSTISANLAELIAHAGNRVILLDGDLRNPSLSRSLAPDSDVGLLEVLNRQVALDDAICVDGETGLNFLPAVIKPRMAHTNEILSSEAFSDLIEAVREKYDYIILDLPPLAPVVDVRVAAQIVDSVVYVVEWGKTRINLVQAQLLGAPEVHSRLLGVVLNKADVRILERYEAYYGRHYYKRYYGNPYSNSASS